MPTVAGTTQTASMMALDMVLHLAQSTVVARQHTMADSHSMATTTASRRAVTRMARFAPHPITTIMMTTATRTIVAVAQGEVQAVASLVRPIGTSKASGRTAKASACGNMPVGSVVPQRETTPRTGMLSVGMIYQS